MRQFLLLAAFLCASLPTQAQAHDIHLQTQAHPDYPDSLTALPQHRAKLMDYKVVIKFPPPPPNAPSPTRQTVRYADALLGNKLPPLEYEPALFYLGLTSSAFPVPPSLERLKLDASYSNLPLPEFLDKVATRAKLGWTAREDNGELWVRFVRLSATPPPESFLPDWRWLEAVPDNPMLYPEAVTVPEALRKRLEGVRVNVNLVDRNGVGALISLLDARVDHQFDPGLAFTVERSVPDWNLLTTDILALQKRDPEWLYPGLRLQKVTVKANNVALPTALDMLTQSLGVGWTAELSGERILVRIVRLRHTPSPVKLLLSSLDAIHASAAQLPREPTPLVQTPPSAYLKEMVSLELESASLRTALETLLRTTQHCFELGPEASTLKRSFRFESVSLSSALSLICDSYNVIWSLERDNQDKAFLSIRKRGEAPPKK